MIAGRSALILTRFQLVSTFLPQGKLRTRRATSNLQKPIRRPSSYSRRSGTSSPPHHGASEGSTLSHSSMQIDRDIGRVAAPGLWPSGQIGSRELQEATADPDRPGSLGGLSPRLVEGINPQSQRSGACIKQFAVGLSGSEDACQPRGIERMYFEKALRAVTYSRLCYRRSTMRKRTTLKLVATSKQNAAGRRRRSYVSSRLCARSISRNFGYPVRCIFPPLGSSTKLINSTDSAFHLTSTATLLVRSALETDDNEVARSCLAHVETLRNTLRRVQEEEDWDVADMCLDHCERIMHRLPGTGATTDQSMNAGMADNGLVNPAAISLPETQTNNDIVDDMMSISNTFGTMDGFPFDMTGIWDVSVFQDVNLP